MKASYKIALALSVAVCILAVFLIKGEKQPEPTDTLNDTTQADAAPAPRKTLRSDSPGASGPATDGSVKSMVSAKPQNTDKQAPGSIASDARNRIRAAQGLADREASAKQPTNRTYAQANTEPLNIGNNTTGPIALARTETAPEKNPPKPETTKPSVDQNKALSAIFDSPSKSNTTRPTGAGADSVSNSNAAASKPKPASPAAGANTETTYIIQPGDTFSSIAIDVYNDEGRWVDIAQANSLVDPTRLKVGQVLRMPGEKQLLSQEEESPPGPGGIQTHTIRAGDSLSTVADKYYDDPTLWRIIYNFNRDKIGDNPNAIQAGMTVKVPPKLSGAQ